MLKFSCLGTKCENMLKKFRRLRARPRRFSKCLWKHFKKSVCWKLSSNVIPKKTGFVLYGIDSEFNLRLKSKSP